MALIKQKQIIREKTHLGSVADPGCPFIPDPGSDFFPSRIRTVSIPDPGSSSKKLIILTPKKAKKMVPKL
jgi:hypothetical protein